MIWGSSAFEKRPAAWCGVASRRGLRAALLAGLPDDRRRRRPGGNDRRRAHQGVFDHPRHQHAARRGTGGGRKRAKGECWVSADCRGDWEYWDRARGPMRSFRTGLEPAFPQHRRRTSSASREDMASKLPRPCSTATARSIQFVRPKSQVFGAREQLRNTEQNTLLSGLTAYMDVLENTSLGLDNNNVDVLKEQLRETRDRFTVGEVTRTDVAQAEASLARQGTALSAVATLQAAVARYRQFIGDQPTSLAPVKPLMRPIPKTLPEAISISQIEHPAISGSLHGVDAAELQVKIAEGALYPTVGLSASFTNQYDSGGTPGLHQLAGQIAGQITIPIYQGGAEYAATRQAKESLSQQEIQTDSLRNQVRQAVVAAWGLNEAAVGVVRRPRVGLRQRSGADRCARRGQGRTADDARRAQRPTGFVAGANDAGSGRA